MNRWSAWAVAAGLILGAGGAGSSLAAEAGWQKDAMGWQYLAEGGEAVKSDWRQVGGRWYYLDKDGYMVTGWRELGPESYFFLNSGELASGWCYREDKDRWYYFRPDGTKQTGWLQDDGDWYWFNGEGEMVKDGYSSIDGVRYYFYDDGRMAANRYVGIYYMDENGQRDPSHDIQVEGRRDSVPSEDKDRITEAMANIPRGWMKHFIDHGWEILYYTDKDYFSAPDTDEGVCYVKHKLDTSYRKLKIIDPDEMTQGFGEYIGYASGVFEEDSEDGAALMLEQGLVTELIDMPSYFSDDIKYYFGSLCKAYLELDGNRAFEDTAPEVDAVMKKILYSKEP